MMNVGRYTYLCRRQIHSFMQRNSLRSSPGSCVVHKRKYVFLDTRCGMDTRCGTDTGRYGWLPCQRRVATIHTTSHCVAGHNRWSNIKHIKGRSDQKRAALYDNHLRIIRGVVHNRKETNPKFNTELARCLAAAKAAGVPADVLTRTMDKLKRTDLKPHMLEVEGPDGVCGLLHCKVTGEQETAQLQGPLKKKGFNAGRNVKVAYKFEHKGVITAPPIEEGEINLDKYVEIGLEVGAEDVTLESDEDGKPFIQFICQPGEMNMVTNKMEKMDLKDIECQEVYNPIYPVTVTQEKADEIHSIFKKIMSRFDCIEDMTFNFEIVGENE